METLNENSALLLYRLPEETDLKFSIGSWTDNEQLDIVSNNFHFAPFESEENKFIRIDLKPKKLQGRENEINDLIFQW